MNSSTWTIEPMYNKGVQLSLRCFTTSRYLLNLVSSLLCIQGYNARKVISEVYASFLLRCTVFVEAWHGIHLLHKKSMKYSGHRKLLCELSKLSKLDALILLGYLTSIDASIFVYKFRPERTGFNMYAEYTQLQLSLHYNLVTSKDIRSFF